MNLNQVTVFTKNINESIDFYKALGLKLIVDSAPRYVRFECPDGDSTFSLHLADEQTSNNSVIFYFECVDVDAEHRRLKGLGFEFDLEPTDRNWLWREALLKDPGGNPIVLYSAGKNRKNPPWRIAD